MMNVVLLGATGLVGNCILHQLIATSDIKAITTLTRRPLKQSLDKVTSVIDKDPATWFENSALFQGKDVAISAFGTTRADAGGIENFKQIDYGNNLKFAKAAKANGIKTFVLISTMGANSKSWFPYLKIKGQLEQDIIDLGFDHTIIFQPGFLVGDRERPRFGESAAIKMTKVPLLGSLIDTNDASQIGKKVVEMLGSSDKVKVLSRSEINQ